MVVLASFFLNCLLPEVATLVILGIDVQSLSPGERSLVLQPRDVISNDLPFPLGKVVNLRI